jgi:hypothetical protein
MLKKLNNNPSLLSRKEEAQALAGGVQVGGVRLLLSVVLATPPSPQLCPQAQVKWSTGSFPPEGHMDVSDMPLTGTLPHFLLSAFSESVTWERCQVLTGLG